jgi:hypothetical protein
MLKQNMSRHLDTFFESFIKNIQSADFDTAFANSMELLHNGEPSTSLSRLSFRDTVLMRDTLHQGRFVEEERNGEVYEVFILNNPIDSLRSIVADTRISEVIRQEIAELFGFNFRAAQAVSAERADNVNPADEESKLISKDYFWGTWTLIYSCGKVEIITEKQIEEDPEARRKVNQPVSGGFPAAAPSTGTHSASPSISVTSGVSI